MTAPFREWLEPRVRRWWRGEPGGWGPLFTALAVVPGVFFAAAVRLRATMYETGLRVPARASIPVISVGNLSVGGTGKTPVTAWVIRELLKMGRGPAVVYRGYGEDEGLLHARWNPGVPVIRAPRRILGVRMAIDAGCDVAVLDDGFQHRQMARDLDVVLISPSQPLPARLLPRGPYREPLRAVKRAHLVFITEKHGEAAAGARLAGEIGSIVGAPPTHRLPLEFAGWMTLAGLEKEAPQEDVLAVASIANPEPFQRATSSLLGREIELLAFPDHHEYTAEDVARIAARAGSRGLVTTEKDAVKLDAFRELLPPAWVLTLEPTPDSGAEDALRRALTRVLHQSEGTRGTERVSGSRQGPA